MNIIIIDPLKAERKDFTPQRLNTQRSVNILSKTLWKIFCRRKCGMKGISSQTLETWNTPTVTDMRKDLLAPTPRYHTTSHHTKTAHHQDPTSRQHTTIKTPAHHTKAHHTKTPPHYQHTTANNHTTTPPTQLSQKKSMTIKFKAHSNISGFH